jgi:hypothetical protein
MIVTQNFFVLIMDCELSHMQFINHNGLRVWLESVGGASRADIPESTTSLFSWQPPWLNFCPNDKCLG